MIYVVSFLLQKDYITKYCFGECKKVILGVLDIDGVGPVFPCTEDVCKYEDKCSPVIGEFHGDEIKIRKLMEE